MERIEEHRGCYKRALSLFKEECGPVLATCLIVLLAVVLQGTVGYTVWLCTKTIAVGTLLMVFSQFIFGLLVTGPILLGAGRWFYLLPTKRLYLYEVFYYFESKRNYRRAMRFCLHLLWRVALAGCFYSLPAMILELLIQNFESTLMGIGILYSLLIVLQAVALICGFGLFIYHCLRYFLAGYLLFEQEDMNPLLCIGYSYDLTKEHRFDILMLLMSLFPIYLTFVLVVPLFFTVPYLSLLCSYKAHELLERSLHTS